MGTCNVSMLYLMGRLYLHIVYSLVGVHSFNVLHGKPLSSIPSPLSLSFSLSSSSLSASSSLSTPIYVYDSVVSEPQKLFSTIPPEQNHNLYTRSNPPSNPLESTLNRILQNLNDTSPYVEYWHRQNWRSLDVHSDVDEAHAKSLPAIDPLLNPNYSADDPYKYPSHGHVLYLDISGPQLGDGEGGHTVVFSDSHVYAIPPKQGRLLRFDGRYRHGVPRPPLAYFDESVGGSNHLLWTRKARDEERRGVVLFNSWRERPEGDWEDIDEDVHSEAEVGFCSERDKWEEIRVFESGGERLEMKVPLLGDARRRGRMERSWRFEVLGGRHLIDSFRSNMHEVVKGYKYHEISS